MSEGLNKLPFDISVFREERPPIQIGKVVIPVYGDLTVEEAAQWDVLAIESKDIPEDERDRWWVKQIATLIIRSRHNKAFKFEQAGNLPKGALDKLVALFINERNQWRKLEPIDEVKKKLKVLANDFATQRQKEIGEQSTGSLDTTTQANSNSVDGVLEDAS